MRTKAQAPINPDAEFYTVADFMKIYPIGLTKTYEMIGTGDLPSVKIGRRRLISASGARACFASLAA